MTLLLSVITADFVVQASDRRVTRGTKVVDDDTVKSVLFNGHAAFAFTGLARLPASKAALAHRGAEMDGGYRPTSQWIAEVVSLPAKLMEDVLDNIRVEAEAAFAAMGPAARKIPHGFVGVGWQGTPLEPILYLVSNIVTTTVTRQFHISRAPLAGLPYRLHSSLPLPPKIDKRMSRRMKETVDRKLGAGAVSRVLLETIREVADQNRRGTVGRGIIQVCIPKAPVVELVAEREYRITSGQPPHPEQITFQFFPAGKDEGVAYSPYVTFCGLITPRLISTGTFKIEHVEMGGEPSEPA
jgi:hypothetical protein